MLEDLALQKVVHAKVLQVERPPRLLS